MLRIFNCKKNNFDSLHGICNNPYGLETLSVGSIISCSTDDLQYFFYDAGFLNRVFEILKSRNIYKYVFLFWIIQQQKLQSSCFFHFVICTWESKSLTNSDMLKCLMYRWTFLNRQEKSFWLIMTQCIFIYSLFANNDSYAKKCH